MPNTNAANERLSAVSRTAEFRNGEQVMLAQGTYQGTFGVFVRFRRDPNLADIAEESGRIRSHPVAWLEHRS